MADIKIQNIMKRNLKFNTCSVSSVLKQGFANDFWETYPSRGVNPVSPT